MELVLSGGFSQKRVKLEVYYILRSQGIWVIPYYQLNQYHLEMVVVKEGIIIAVVVFNPNRKMGIEKYLRDNPKDKVKVFKCFSPKNIPKITHMIQELYTKSPHAHI